MACFRMRDLRRLSREIKNILRGTAGSAVLEFSIVLPLLVVFVVGIYDFSAAFNQKQKIEQAAQEGAIIAAAQPTGDIEQSISNPGSLQPVIAAVFNSLAGSGVLAQANQGSCVLPANLQPPPGPNLTLTYTISGCSGYSDTNRGCRGDPSNMLWIAINRGWVGAPVSVAGMTVVPVGTTVTVSYDYHWRFNSAIELLFPSAGYRAKTCISESSTVLNQT